LKRKRTEIAIEFEETIQIVAQERGVSRAWCPACGGLVTMVTPPQAAAVARVSVRVINQRVEAGVVHFLETPEGALLVCMNSLS
jgi:hypothetical protein